MERLLSCLLVVAVAVFLSVVAIGCKKRETVEPSRRPVPQRVSPSSLSAAEIDAKVIEAISAQTGVAKSHITRNLHLVKDLKADDLDRVELVIELEELFGISIKDEDAEKLQTVGQVMDYIRGRLKK